MKIKCKVKNKSSIERSLDYIKCPCCDFVCHLNCLKSYKNCCYKPVDNPYSCPNCDFTAPFVYWLRLRELN